MRLCKKPEHCNPYRTTLSHSLFGCSGFSVKKYSPQEAQSSPRSENFLNKNSLLRVLRGREKKSPRFLLTSYITM